MNHAHRPVEEWIVNAGLRLSRMYRADRYDCEQVVRIRISEGRSRRLAWLESRREIEANYLPTPIADGSTFSDLQSHGSPEIELVTRMMDLEIILESDELAIVNDKIADKTQEQIAESLGVSLGTVKNRLKVIRKKILAYYAS